MSHLLARFLLYALDLVPTSDSVQQWASNTPLLSDKYEHIRRRQDLKDNKDA